LAEARKGDHVTTPRLSGTVEYRGERELMLKLTAPAPGLALVYAYDWRDTTKTNVHLYLFEGSEDVAERERPAWRKWIQPLGASSRPS